MKIVKNIRYFSFFICILSILSACATSDSHTRISGNYKNLMEQQIAQKSHEKIDLKELPEMTSEDYERLGDVNVSQGNLQMAFLQYQKCLEINSKNITVKYKKGMTFVLGGLNDEAVREFREILREKPEHSLAYEGLGLAFFQMRRYEDAERYFGKATELDPTLWKAHNMLGIIFDHRREHKKAIPEYRFAISLRPSDGLLYNNLGVSYLLAGDYEEAAMAFKEGLRLEPSNRRLYNNLGLVLAKQGHYGEALVAFMEHGDESQAYNNLGCVYLQQGERKKAIRSFEKALEIKPTFYDKASQNLKKARAAKVYEIFSTKSDN